MIRIAVADDVEFERKALTRYIRRYAEENNIEIELTVFSDGGELLKDYPGNLNLLLLDIAMPGVDGMTAARKIRRQDRDVIIIFITSMMQYAIQGYSVEAMDFIVKPVSYVGLKLRLDRVMEKIQQNRPKMLEIHNAEGIFPICAMDICYAETYGHRILIHTRDRKLPTEMTLRALEKELTGLPFFRCHTSYVVNLRYVDKVQGNEVIVGGDSLSISRYRRKEFLEAWAIFLGDQA